MICCSLRLCDELVLRELAEGFAGGARVTSRRREGHRLDARRTITPASAFGSNTFMVQCSCSPVSAARPVPSISRAITPTRVATILLAPSVSSPQSFPRCSTTPRHAETISVSLGIRSRWPGSNTSSSRVPDHVSERALHVGVARIGHGRCLGRRMWAHDCTGWH